MNLMFKVRSQGWKFENRATYLIVGLTPLVFKIGRRGHGRSCSDRCPIRAKNFARFPPVSVELVKSAAKVFNVRCLLYLFCHVLYWSCLFECGYFTIIKLDSFIRTSHWL